jgi:hypothetical protein
VSELDALCERTNALPAAFRQKVQRLEQVLGSSLEDVRPGLLLSRIRSFESGVAAWANDEGRELLSPEIIDGMMDVLLTLNDLKATYPVILEIETAATAHVLATREDMEQIRESLRELVNQARETPEIHAPDTVQALEDEITDAELASEETALAPQSAKAEVMARERRIWAYALTTARNYMVAPFRWLNREIGEAGAELFKPGLGKELGKAVRKGVVRGVEKSSEGAVIAIASYIGLKLGGIIGALAPLIPSLRPFHRKAREIEEGLKEEEEDEPNEEDNSSGADDGAREA